MPGCYLRELDELDDALSLTDTAGNMVADARTGKNGRHRLVGLLRQTVFGRLVGYEDVNDAERLCRDPAMRRVVGDRAITGCAASASQMGRFCPADGSTGCTSPEAVSGCLTGSRHRPTHDPLRHPCHRASPRRNTALQEIFSAPEYATTSFRFVGDATPTGS
jgi:Transposase DDE domain group 1